MKLNLNDYRQRVLGCWMGKNIGGTLGAPFEFFRQVNNVSFYTQDLGGEPLPNDDLDLQLLWLIALEERGLDLDAARLAEYWLSYITPHWSEYGTAKVNLRAGLQPPFSGIVGNDWKHSCGAFIRSEIWACIAPGLPDVAVRYAIEDAIVDHGDGEGTWGEVFFAAAESAAFVCDDLATLIEIGLSYIPADCGVARAIRCAVEAAASDMDWREARDEILRQHRGATLFGIPARTSAEDRAKGFDSGELGYDAPVNVALTVLALLIGGDDFGRVVTTATNCGEDTDCTAATAGAMFGLMYGMDAIPSRWIEPIGRQIRTLCLNLGELGHFGGQVPGDVDVLTERTERIAQQLLARHRSRMVLTAEPTDTADLPIDALYAAESLTRDLATRVGVARHRFDFFTVDVAYADGPGIRDGATKAVTLTIRNTYKAHATFMVRWHLPEGWTIEPSAAGALLCLPPIMSPQASATFTVQAGRLTGPVARCVAELTIDGRATVLLVPVIFRNGNLMG